MSEKLMRDLASDVVSNPVFQAALETSVIEALRSPTMRTALETATRDVLKKSFRARTRPGETLSMYISKGRNDKYIEKRKAVTVMLLRARDERRQADYREIAKQIGGISHMFVAKVSKAL